MDSAPLITMMMMMMSICIAHYAKTPVVRYVFQCAVKRNVPRIRSVKAEAERSIWIVKMVG